uniref:Retrovirus-related Pol polyprotein from transposon TNT 1-94 n=1 Tax=Talaromyces marneffei PM1 TaxID=1077442 RepID=A0A093XC52_TALMA
MEDEYGFLSKESGERGEIETSQQKPFTIGQSIGPMIEFQSNKGAEIPTQVDIENEISHDLIPEVRTTDELIPETPTNYTSIPESSTNPERILIESESTLAPTTTLRRTDRVRKPTQAVLESAATEAIYRRKSRQGRRQEAREASKDTTSRTSLAREARLQEVANLAVAIELLLGDNDEFAYNAVKTEGEIPIPQTYEEAVNDPKFGSQWRKAVELEIRNLIRFGTWRFVKRPDHKAVISCKWVFDIKYQADGRIERFKARLVARGFLQQEGLDFEDTFAPVIRLESLRVLFAIAAIYGLTAHLLDATNAFVGSKLDKQIYMEVPKGLPKSLQPRKDEPSTADPGTFINERGTIIALYVDDILVFSKNEKAIELTKEKLKEFHPMKDSGRVNKILGIRITWLDGSIRLDQEFYTIRILEEFDMLESKPQMLPLSPNLNLDEDSPKLSHEAHSQFRHAIGRLTYLAGGTRPDIQRTVNRLSQHLVEPKEIHFKAIKHLLRYLRGTTNYAISYLKGSKDKKLVGYTDAAYGNASNLRSTTGYIFMLAGGPICWSSRKQPITATSSSEAEYIAAADSAKQVI